MGGANGGAYLGGANGGAILKGANVVMWGQVEGHPVEPIAWTYRRNDGGRSFYTSLGNAEDFRGRVLPALLENALVWGVSK